MTEPDSLPRHTNRLASEDSPYLRQHAHDPVDWYPWGEAAFAEAKQANKPVFLSIGYSTCHWCHVMARTCFNDEAIAEVLNKHFVAIKLDREQRPDLDEIYLNAVRLLSGQGGWPMSLWLTPDARPFYGGTYFAPEAFLELLEQLIGAWRDQPDEVLARAEKIVESLQAVSESGQGAQALAADLLSASLAQLALQADRQHGGFFDAPKFPEEPRLMLQLQAYRRKPDAASLRQLQLTLDRMSQGGLYDQVGGGFHRYAVDAEWQVPHFEKMLFNQGLLLQVYTEAYDLTGEDSYLRIALDTADYVLGEMRSSTGLFYAATDADANGKEGGYFTWTPEEVHQVLGSRDATLVCSVFNVTDAGNFHCRSVLHLDQSLESHARASGAPVAWLRLINRLLARLRQARVARAAPHRDEQVITAWNGLLIAGLVKCALATGQRGYGTQAARTADALWERMKVPGGLMRIALADRVLIPATLEDYSFFADSLLQLYQYGGEERWLARAQTLEQEMLAHFWDGVAGGYFLSGSSQAGPVITRLKSVVDSAIPSANAMAVSVLLRLYEATGDRALLQRANACVASFAGELNAEPLDACTMLMALDRMKNGGMDNVQFAADGNIKVTLVKHLDRAELLVAMRPGWYLSVPANIQPDDAQRTADEALTPLRVTSDAPLSVVYPEPASRRLAFARKDTLVYQNLIRVKLNGLVQGQAISLHLQACSDQLCLPPQVLKFRFFSANEAALAQGSSD